MEKKPKISGDLKNAEVVLEADHYGLDKSQGNAFGIFGRTATG